MTLLQLAVLAASMALALSAIMAAGWYVQKRTGHTGWIDVTWTFGVGAVAAAGSLVPLGENPHPGVRQAMVAVLIALWSLRLGGHILLRTLEAGDDPRYREWIREWGVDADRRMFWLLQVQAAVGLVLTV